MKRKSNYRYPKSLRETIDGKRHYVYGKEKLPSVTTILSATQSPEKTASLSAWRQRVGEAEATRIVDTAGARGTAMHKILGLCNVPEYYGIECNVYYPGLYAGATDLVGIHKGEDAIIDFKQTNKPKKREWIEDYCIQLAAYGMAHDYMHKTTINKGVIMMCSKDNFYQEFVISGSEYKKYKHQWLGKISQYYANQNKEQQENIK